MLIGFLVLVAVGLVLSTSLIVVRAQIRAYELRIQSLHAVAGQYKVVNDSYVTMQETEQDLAARKALLEPLVQQRANVLGVLEGMRHGFPTGIWIGGLSVPATGGLQFTGTARSFEDVGRFMKWLTDKKGYAEVTLVRVSDADGQVSFEVTAGRERGGETVAASQQR